MIFLALIFHAVTSMLLQRYRTKVEIAILSFCKRAAIIAAKSTVHFKKFIAALTHERWLKAWGILPICSPSIPTSSENMPRWFEKERALSKLVKASLRSS